MENSHDAVDDIETEFENTNISKIEEDQEGNIDETALEIPTFGFTEKSWKTDFVLIVDGIRLYVNKTILALASPVFDTMFQSEFKESSCDELELPGKRLRDVVDFFRYIYPKNSAQFTQESAFNVLPLFEEYQVLHLKPRCELSLLEHISQETPVEELFRILQVACLYKLVNLRKLCVKIACKKSQEDIDEAFDNNPPPAEVAKEILEQLNMRLREKLCEQKTLINDMSKQATENIEALKTKQELLIKEAADRSETLKAKTIEQERQLNIFKQYLSADVKKNKVVSLGIDNYWREITTIFDVNMGMKSNKVKREVDIWNIPLVICVSYIESTQKDKYLHLRISCDSSIHSKLKGRAIIVNRQPQGENEIVIFDGSLCPCPLLFISSDVRKNLMKISDVKYISNGFLSDGHIGIIVQVYMSEPNRG